MKPIVLVKRSQLTLRKGPPYRVEDIVIYGDIRRVYTSHTIGLHSFLGIKQAPYIWY